MTPFAKTVTEQKPLALKHLKEGKTGALLATYADGFKAIIKPMKRTLPNGKKLQRGIPVCTHPQREVAFYELAKLMGLAHLVPETVLTSTAVDGAVASAQVFFPAAYHLKQLQPKLEDVHAKRWKRDLVHTALRVPKMFWRQLLALDIVAGVRDRHANNVGVLMTIENEQPAFRIVAWDNAVSFGKTFARYHNIFHKFLFRKSVSFENVWPVWDKLTLEDMTRVLSPYLSSEEINHAFMRMAFFQDYPYRLPWKVVSQGNDAPSEFPDYKAYFTPFVETPQLLLR